MNIPYEWIWWIAQIAIDVILVVALFVLLSKLKKAKGSGADGQTQLAAHDFVEQAGQLAREFDRLLGEKRELVGTTLSTLDVRVAELRAMLEQANALQQQLAAAPPSHTPTLGSNNKTAIPVRPASPVLLEENEDPFNLPPGHPLHQVNNESSSVSAEQDFRHQVVKLHGQGRTPQEIALATGRPRAEVELLLALVK